MSNTAFMDHLKQLFAECDLDGSGSLGRDEFKELCSKIGLNTEVAEETFQRLDIDKNSQITFDEFAAGFNQYKQAIVAQAAAPNSKSPKPMTQPSAQGSQVRANSPASKMPPGSKLTPGPVTARARSRGSSNGATNSVGSGAIPASLGLTGGSRESNGTNLMTASGRSTSSSGTQFELSSSSDLNSSYEFSPIQQSASACNLTSDRPSPASTSTSQQVSNNDGNVVVYSSDMINPTDSCNSGQFGSMLSSSSSYSQFKTMQDLLECVQKLQNENQILTQIFFKDKREREEYINQLGEEFDQQLKEVEERANRRAREELEAEKRRLREMMQTERETLQHHYQTLEKMSKLVKSGGSGSGSGNAGANEDIDSGLFKVKTQLEDTFNENRQLKKSLLDTKTDVALIWKEMEKLKKQYETKLSSAYEKQRETQHECDHIKKQLSLMKDSNQKLQDASDVITSYIADKVEPVIKVALDGNDEMGVSFNGCSMRVAGSASNSRRGSILSEYLNEDNGDAESEASSGAGARHNHRISKSASTNRLGGNFDNSSDLSENFLNVPNKHPKQAIKAQVTKSVINKSESTPGTKGEILAKTTDGQTQAGSTRQSLKNLKRHFLGGRQQTPEIKDSKQSRNSLEIEADKIKSADLACVDQLSDEDSVEPADGPSQATFNIILVGDSFVGKSSFAARFIEGNFVQGLISNCSIDFKTKSYKVNDVNYTVNLWDTAGQERFRSITASYFRKADGIILMYDVTDRRSYLNVRNWMSTISDTAAENVAVLLVGNKIDLRQNDNKAKCVPTEEGSRLAREYDIVFLETSVKTGTNLLPSMGKLIRLIAKNTRAEGEDTDRIRLSDKSRTFNCMPKNC